MLAKNVPSACPHVRLEGLAHLGHRRHVQQECGGPGQHPLRLRGREAVVYHGIERGRIVLAAPHIGEPRLRGGAGVTGGYGLWCIEYRGVFFSLGGGCRGVWVVVCTRV